MSQREPIIVTRTVSIAPADVWPYLTTGALWARWQGRTCSIDPVPGGVFEMTMPDGLVAAGRVLEIAPPRRIVFSWGWQGTPLEPGSTTVEITLEPQADGGTLITLTHRDLPTEAIEHHTGGWERCLDALVQVAAAT